MSDLNSNNQESLSLAIKKTIVFFDLFDYPLTPYEIFNYLEQKFLLTDIISALGSLADIFENYDGFYFLVGRAEIIKLRQARYNYAVRKLKIAKFFARIFSLLPYIKMVALVNVMGAHNMRDEGDIDFFIISSPGRLFLSRLFCAGLAKILNKRPTEYLKRDKLCLSFYLSDDNLNLDNLKIQPFDPYLDYWPKTVVLLYNKKRTYENFLAANRLKDPEPIINAQAAAGKNALLDFFELAAKKLQLKIMSPALKKVLSDSQGKFINDKILKLHWRDLNAEILEKFNYALHKIS